MSDKSQKALFWSAGVFAALFVVAVIWRIAHPSSRTAGPDGFMLRDIPPASPDASLPQAPPRMPPLASIPWKRDDDSITPISILIAQLPWVRRADQPTAIALMPAELPWVRPIGNSKTPNSPSVSAKIVGPMEARSVEIEPAALPWDQQRAASFAPVFLVMADLPWRH